LPGARQPEVSGFGFTLRKRVEEVDSIARNSFQMAEQLQKVRSRLEETQSDFTYQVRSQSRNVELSALGGTLKPRTVERPYDGSNRYTGGKTLLGGAAAPSSSGVGACGQGAEPEAGVAVALVGRPGVGAGGLAACLGDGVAEGVAVEFLRDVKPGRLA
jgi:hypothetical protein